MEYIPLDYSYIRQALNHLELGPDDVIYDLGCGMGRITCVAAQQKVKEVVGIDINEELVRRARENATRVRGRRAHISLVCADCRRTDMSNGTIYFLFDPFFRCHPGGCHRTHSIVICQQSETNKVCVHHSAIR